MVEHLGHLVQRPSGISRFFDFELASFGFLIKLVSVGAGGVTAGSEESLPRRFLGKLVDMNGNGVRGWVADYRPRARVQTHTWRAPACRSRRAQALVVEPVVRT